MKLNRLFAVSALALAVAGSAGAQEVRFTGSTSGGFSGVTPGLSYTGSTFDDMTSGGFLAFGALAPLTTNNFGVFTLQGPATTQSFNGTFLLNITFTTPTGISGSGQTQQYTASVTGQVGNDGSGGVFIDFDNSARALTFTGPGLGGNFTLSVNDVSLNGAAFGASNSIALSGNIRAASNTTVPEPSTYALMAAGLAALGVVSRRRRQNV